MGIILPAHTVKTLEIQQPDPAGSRYDQGMNSSGEEKWRGAGNHSFYLSGQTPLLQAAGNTIFCRLSGGFRFSAEINAQLHNAPPEHCCAC